MAVSAVLANCAFAGIGGANQDALTPNPKLLERAKALLNKAPFIDTHNDLPSMFLETKAGDLTSFDMSKVQPTLCADIPRLREGCVGAQYWSVFVESGTQKTHTSLHEALREFDVRCGSSTAARSWSRRELRTTSSESIKRDGSLVCWE